MRNIFSDLFMHLCSMTMFRTKKKPILSKVLQRPRGKEVLSNFVATSLIFSNKFYSMATCSSALSGQDESNPAL